MLKSLMKFFKKENDNKSKYITEETYETKNYVFNFIYNVEIVKENNVVIGIIDKDYTCIIKNKKTKSKNVVKIDCLINKNNFINFEHNSIIHHNLFKKYIDEKSNLTIIKYKNKYKEIDKEYQHFVINYLEPFQK